MSQVLTNIYDLYTPAATAPGAELVQRCRELAQQRAAAEFAALSRPSLFVSGPRRLCTPMEAARVATVTVRERFNHDHLRRVLDARNYRIGE